MLVDSSVLVAILSDEEDAEHWAGRIEGSGNCVTTPLVVLETTMRLSTMLAVEPVEAGTFVTEFLSEAAIDIVPVEASDAETAIRAFAEYGKGRGHPARLNLADCLVYGCAKRLGVSLLYKGEDFARTDLG